MLVVAVVGYLLIALYFVFPVDRRRRQSHPS
jgi:hypothetical protein